MTIGVVFGMMSTSGKRPLNEKITALGNGKGIDNSAYFVVFIWTFRAHGKTHHGDLR